MFHTSDSNVIPVNINVNIDDGPDIPVLKVSDNNGECDLTYKYDFDRYGNHFDFSHMKFNLDDEISDCDIDITEIPDQFNDTLDINGMDHLLNFSDLQFDDNAKPSSEFVVRSRQIFIYLNHTQRKIINS